MIERLLAKIANSEGCLVLSPSEVQPILAPGLRLPQDVATFYSMCGGLILFENEPFSMKIAGPEQFEPSNLAILGAGPQGDPSDSWYVIAMSGSDQFISVDLAPDRNGRCYDSFWDRHAIAGSCPIIALSFSEFLLRSFESGGKELYWLASEFVSPGDAYS